MTSFFKKIRLYFISGMLIILPIGVTLFIINWILKLALQLINAFPDHMNPLYYLHQYLLLPDFVDGLFSVIVLLIITTILGLITKNFLGNKVIMLWDTLLSKLPIVKTIYSSTKQVIEAIFHPSSMQSFREVVLVPFPTEKSWSIAFITNTQEELHSQIQTDDVLISVFVPTTPNPTSGYLLIIEKSKVKPTNFTVEQGFKLVISGGVIKNSPIKPQRNKKN